MGLGGWAGAEVDVECRGEVGETENCHGWKQLFLLLCVCVCVYFFGEGLAVPTFCPLTLAIEPSKSLPGPGVPGGSCPRHSPQGLKQPPCPFGPQFTHQQGRRLNPPALACSLAAILHTKALGMQKGVE